MPISSAIKNAQRLAFIYDGHSRVVEPHTFGIDHKGQRTLRAYQVEGGSGSGEEEGWKLFHLDRMERLTALPDHFPGPRPRYRRDDPAFAAIYAQL